MIVRLDNFFGLLAAGPRRAWAKHCHDTRDNHDEWICQYRFYLRRQGGTLEAGKGFQNYHHFCRAVQRQFICHNPPSFTEGLASTTGRNLSRSRKSWKCRWTLSCNLAISQDLVILEGIEPGTCVSTGRHTHMFCFCSDASRFLCHLQPGLENCISIGKARVRKGFLEGGRLCSPVLSKFCGIAAENSFPTTRGQPMPPASGWIGFSLRAVLVAPWWQIVPTYGHALAGPPHPWSTLPCGWLWLGTLTSCCGVWLGWPRVWFRLGGMKRHDLRSSHSSCGRGGVGVGVGGWGGLTNREIT